MREGAYPQIEEPAKPIRDLEGMARDAKNPVNQAIQSARGLNNQPDEQDLAKAAGQAAKDRAATPAPGGGSSKSLSKPKKTNEEYDIDEGVVGSIKKFANSMRIPTGANRFPGAELISRPLNAVQRIRYASALQDLNNPDATDADFGRAVTNMAARRDASIGRNQNEEIQWSDRELAHMRAVLGEAVAPTPDDYSGPKDGPSIRNLTDETKKPMAKKSMKEEAEHPAVKAFASQAHEDWRRGFDPEGSGKERVKKNSDGSEGNINVPFDDLHPDWQRENLAAGRAALEAVQTYGDDTEAAAEHVHNEWMKRNPKADYNAAQHVPYEDLPEDEKDKDRAHVRTMRGLLSDIKESYDMFVEEEEEKVKRGRGNPGGPRGPYRKKDVDVGSGKGGTAIHPTIEIRSAFRNDKFKNGKVTVTHPETGEKAQVPKEEARIFYGLHHSMKKAADRLKVTHKFLEKHFGHGYSSDENAEAQAHSDDTAGSAGYSGPSPRPSLSPGVYVGGVDIFGNKL
jgi:hypothetical protein